ncbi:hypothetical protein Q2941_37440 [Bradyrhizobium sp. UFLA05-153]
MSSRFDRLAVIDQKLKVASFLAYGESAGDLQKLRAAHAAIDKRVQLFAPWDDDEPSLALKRTPSKRRPSLMRAIRQTAKTGHKVKTASVDPEGKIVLQLEHNLDDSHVQTITSDEETEWDIRLRQ